MVQPSCQGWCRHCSQHGESASNVGRKILEQQEQKQLLGKVQDDFVPWKFDFEWIAFATKKASYFEAGDRLLFPKSINFEGVMNIFPIGSMYGIFTYICHEIKQMKVNIPVPWILWAMLSLNQNFWKINMEPSNHPLRKENDLPNLHDYVPC